MMPQLADIEAADKAARNWRYPDARPLLPGSNAQKQAACRMFREMFNPYKPAVIDWPRLDPPALERLTSLPIWNIAVQTEGKARLRMLSYANSRRDPEWREAIGQNGWEEGRHKEVLANLVQAYGIKLEPEPRYIEPRDTDWAYLVTGFSEWTASSHSACSSSPRWQRPWFEAHVVAVWSFLIWERIGIARSVDSGDNDCTVSGSQSVSNAEVTPGTMLRICLAENDRRFAGYDPRLLRPTTVPSLARVALRFLRA